MPNAHDAFAHLAGACRIRTSHVRLLQMRSRRKNRYSVRSNEVRRCWLARWRIAAANVGHASARRYRKARIENTRSRAFAGRGAHCRRNHNCCPILISLSSESRDRKTPLVGAYSLELSNIDHRVRTELKQDDLSPPRPRQFSVTESLVTLAPDRGEHRAPNRPNADLRTALQHRRACRIAAQHFTLCPIIPAGG
jgi:hypothetical protein